MSSAGGDRHGRRLAAGAGYEFGSHDDMDSFFFFNQDNSNSQPVGGADEFQLGYSDYLLQGSSSLDPAGLARLLDAPVDKHELSVDVDSQGTGSGAAVRTPNSSVSFSYSDGEAGKSGRRAKAAAEEEDDGRGGTKQHLLEDGENSKKARKQPKKKAEKRQRLPRVSFLTKSEVDHLEDGYRWRKYGQKAVKNSPYPRSYYRCTTAKCGVKKRVERSFQDASTVITTYEGQHTHHSPASIRGSTAAHLFMAPSTALGGFGPPAGLPTAEQLMSTSTMMRSIHQHQYYYSMGGAASSSVDVPNMYSPSPPMTTSTMNPSLQQHQLLADYALSRDLFPAFTMPKNNPGGHDD